MDVLDATGRAFWSGVLSGGGSTALPRWTLDPVPGTAEHAVTVPRDVADAVRRLADELAVPVSSVVLAAHAVVLAALSGEREVVTGYLPPGGGRPLPCPLTTAPATWRETVLRAHAVESSLQRHADVPVDDLRRELGLPGPSSESVFDPTGRAAGLGADAVLDTDAVLDADAVLAVALVDRDGGLALRLRHRTDVLDAACAARIAGYHVTALAAMAAEPDAEHGRQCLLSPQERDLQLHELAGPAVELPDRRVHELVEQRAAAHPDAVAAVCGDRRWTYRELDERANRLAHALRARGLAREDVVAVVTARDLDWLAAVLGVLKAGGAYLPVEPHFPADRIATTLARADCRLVLTQQGSTGSLDTALASLPGVRAVLVEDAYREDHPTTRPGVDVTPDQLAYIYFTSGSTGAPKGAMCEQAGMLNHISAKISDLGIGEGQVVAQTAPQCFDISLWQLLSALVVGGSTLLVEQEAVLDVERFVDTIADGRVAVLQVVPSYLEVVLSYLEQHPRDLPDLRCVSVTGEAIKAELARRWFAVVPGVPLVNAYGLTETSDDTNHHVMHAPPEGDRVPLGRPIANVWVGVVDEHLQPVPLGAPGEIVFSGVCVGRGYVNDPERTRLAFLPDPHHEGQRLYRSGDHGRWLPDGALEFHGRRDDQVKVAGFRIEIGEVEGALLRAPGVRDGAVVVAGTGEQSRHLVAFYTGPRQLDAGVLRDRLAATLPEYMVPTTFTWRQALPLTGNGKIDKKALTALAAELAAEDDGAQDRTAPTTPTELRLAAEWARLLDLPQDRIGRRDSFLELGGTSLLAVKLVIALGRAVSLQDVLRHPVLADLATLLDGDGPTAATTTSAVTTGGDPR